MPKFADALLGNHLLTAQSQAMMDETRATGARNARVGVRTGFDVDTLGCWVGAGTCFASRSPEERPGHIGGFAGFPSAVLHAPDNGITISLPLNQANIDPNLLARDTLDLILIWQGR